MSDHELNQTLKDIRPPLVQVAPQTFWFSLGFSIFNVVIGVALYNMTIFFTFQLVGIIPFKAWSIIFMIQGAAMLFALIFNNWKLTRMLHAVGILIKTAWWLELAAIAATSRSLVLLYVWSLLLFLQIIVWIYFTPRVSRAK